MFRLFLLFLTLSGLQAAPVVAPKGLPKPTYQLPDDFRQGTEPSRKFLVDLNTGLVQEHLSEMDRRAVPADVPVKRTAGGWVRVEEPSTNRLPEGFRQGTEPVQSLPSGFRQGTEPSRPLRDNLRQETEHVMPIPEGFRQGTEPVMPSLLRAEPSRSLPAGFRQGTEPSDAISAGFRQGTEPSHQISEGLSRETEESFHIPEGFRQGTEPNQPFPAGFRQGTEPSDAIPAGFRQATEPADAIPAGFRQGTEPSDAIPSGFRQGTEPSDAIPAGFRQGTEPSDAIPAGIRQGTEPIDAIPEGFRQGTEPSDAIPAGFRQGTEPSDAIPAGFRQGTEPSDAIPAGFRQGTEPSHPRIKTQIGACLGEIISGVCYEFHPTPLAFKDAQERCRALAPHAELASVTSADLHSRLVSLVTEGGQRNPKMTWLGATVKKQQASWSDGSEWSYSDWMPGHPNIHTDKPVCVEMFKIDESWWTAADCELKRASICSFPIAA